MKRLFRKIINVFKNFFLWVWRECRDWRTLLLLALVCIAIGTPVWGCGILYLLFGWEWALAVALACLAFWWLPGVPFFTVSLAVTLAIKRIAETVLKRKKQNREDDSVLPAEPDIQKDVHETKQGE